MASELSELFAQPVELDFLGKKLLVFPMDFNDLSVLEAEYNTLESFDLGDASVSLFILWLAIRKADPSVTDEDRKECRYKLTRFDVGRMIPASKKKAVLPFLVRFMQISGLIEEDPEAKNE